MKDKTLNMKQFIQQYILNLSIYYISMRSNISTNCIKDAKKLFESIEKVCEKGETND